MNLSVSWLNDYVDLSDLSVGEVCDQLRTHSCEVEDCYETFPHFSGYSWARISAVEKHPNADRLSLCRVRFVVGNEKKAEFREDPKQTGDVQIVCGASNVREGMLSILAPVGTKIASGMEIQASKIRGVVSQGMLCAWSEIGLGSLQSNLTSNFSDEEKSIEKTGGAGKEQANNTHIIDLDPQKIWHCVDAGLTGLQMDWKMPQEKRVSLKRCVDFNPATFFAARDWIIEIDNKSITHRPDLWSHFGFARELAAILDRPVLADPLKFPHYLPLPYLSWRNNKNGKGKPLKKRVLSCKGKIPARPVSAEAETVHAYYGATFDRIEQGPSPIWMQTRLMNLGSKPVNNIVDATNYLLYDIGQPCHAFSLDRLQGKEIHVGRLYSGSGDSEKSSIQTASCKVKTLDGVVRHCPEDTLLIFDSSDKNPKKTKEKAKIKNSPDFSWDTREARGLRPIALAGVMGGMDTAIGSGCSQQVFLESAVFFRKHIRHSMHTLNLRTDASRVFEKGQDPNQAKPAVARFFYLLQLTAPAIILSSPIHGFAHVKRNRLQVRLSFLQAKLGVYLKVSQVQNLLQRLHIEVRIQKRLDDVIFLLRIPSFRSQYDITIPEDIVEEIGRLIGYDHLMREKKLRAIPAHTQNQKNHLNLERRFQQEAKHFFAEAGGFREVYNYSFVSPSQNTLFSTQESICLANPVDKNRSVLRNQLFSGLLENALVNRNGMLDFRLFEMGRTYHVWPSNKNSFSQTINSQSRTESLLRGQTAPCKEIRRLTWIDYRAHSAARTTQTKGWLESALIDMRILLDKFFSKFGGFVSFERISETNMYHPESAVQIIWQKNAPSGMDSQTTSIGRGREKALPSGKAKEKISLGSYGLLHPRIMRATMGRFAIDRVIVGEIFLDRLFHIRHILSARDTFKGDYLSKLAKLEGGFYFDTVLPVKLHSEYSFVSIFPPLSFEIALIIPRKLGSEAPVRLIRELQIPEIREIVFLHSYTGSPLPSDKKSVSYRIHCLSDHRTLENADLQKIIEKINEICRKESLTMRDAK